VALLALGAQVDSRSQYRTGQRREPEQPQLLHRPSAYKDRGTRAASRVEGPVGYGNTTQDHYGQNQPDGDTCESGWSAAVRGAEHCEHKQHSQEHFRNEACRHAVMAGRVVNAVAIGGETSEGRIVTTGNALGDEQYDCGSKSGPDDLGDPVTNHLPQRHALAEKHSETDCWVDVAAGNGPQGIGHGHQRQAKGKSDAHIVDLSAGNDGGTKSCENQNEGPK